MDFEKLPTDFWVTNFQFTKNTHHELYPSIDPTKPELSLRGKVAIVTGASRGVGAKGILPAFAKAGVKGLILVATDAEKLKKQEAAVKEINPEVQTLAVPTDITDGASVTSLFEKIKGTFGHADILINCAAVMLGGGNIHEEDPESWWKNFEVNVKGAFLLQHQFLQQLPPSSPGSIVNYTTVAAWIVVPTMSSYSISKMAAQQLATHIATAYPNVTVVAVNPGLVDTDMLMPQMRRFELDDPALLGGLAVWLSGERAKFLSGTSIAANWDVDGLVERAEEIKSQGLLTYKFNARLGKDQFE